MAKGNPTVTTTARFCQSPFEQPTKFEIVINLKTAKQIGLNDSANVLARTNKVIK